MSKKKHSPISPRAPNAQRGALSVAPRAVRPNQDAAARGGGTDRRRDRRAREGDRQRGANTERAAATIEEIGLEDMLLVRLQGAKNALRRKDLDEIDDFFEYVTSFPRELWPVEVARFVDRYKRPRGLRSKKERAERFFSNPNRVAAEYAARLVKHWRDDWARNNPKRPMPHKVRRKFDGARITLHNMAVWAAVRRINEGWKDAMDARELAGHRVDDAIRRRIARPEIVKDLLRRGRTACPRPPSKW
jgi:hypothetical protein